MNFKRKGRRERRVSQRSFDDYFAADLDFHPLKTVDRIASTSRYYSNLTQSTSTG